MLAAAGCATPYELREFDLSAPKAEWGSMYLGIHSRGHWNEGGLSVQGTPYQVGFAPRVTEAPSPDCALRILNLRVTAEGEETPRFTAPRLDLEAGPPRPNEPNWRAHSRYFHFVPLENAYVTSGTFKGVDLPYKPLRVTFDLQGSAACPAVFHMPIAYDLAVKPHLWKGKSGPLPSV